MADDPEPPAPVPPAVSSDRPGVPAAEPAASAERPTAAAAPNAPTAGPVSSAASSTAAPKAPVAKPAAGAAPAAAAAKAPAAKPAPGVAAAPKAAHEPPKAAPPSGPTDPPPPADATLPLFITSLQAAIPGSVSQVSYYLGDWTIIVPVSQLLAAARYLRDAPESRFDYCSDVTATDWPPRAERFDVLYMLYSIRHRHRVRIKVKVADQQALPSVTGIWPAADWFEREIWDMFGVNITGHPDRRRILMPEDWQGFPQRKDYPLEGPGELLMENPLDWLKLKQTREEADIE